MDILTIVFDGLLLTILARVLFVLLRMVHRHELALARWFDSNPLGALVPIRIDTRSPDLEAFRRARRGGHSQGA
jgi:hypothetical protein